MGGKRREGEGEEKEEWGKEGKGEGEGGEGREGEGCVMAFRGMGAPGLTPSELQKLYTKDDITSLSSTLCLQCVPKK